MKEVMKATGGCFSVTGRNQMNYNSNYCREREEEQIRRDTI